MPCFHYEYELAKQDGCEFRFHAKPKRILGNAHVEGLEVETPQGVEQIPCDMVIKALGQGARGEFRVPDHPKVLVGGDCANGGAEIVNAAAEGVRAAHKIHEMLSKRGGYG